MKCERLYCLTFYKAKLLFDVLIFVYLNMFVIYILCPFSNTGTDTYRSNLTSRDFHQRPRAAESTKKESIGAYQSYLNSDTIAKLRACYKIIQQVTRLIDRVEYGHVVSTEPSQMEFYDESRVFNNSLEGSAHEGFLPSGSFHPAHSALVPLHEHSQPQEQSPQQSQHTLPLPPFPSVQPTEPIDFQGFYNSSTQSLQHINKDLFTPSILHQAEFQASKEYFQRSLYDSSGALFAAQDAQNANLRIFPVGANPSVSATQDVTGAVGGGSSGNREGPAVLASATQPYPTGKIHLLFVFDANNLFCCVLCIGSTLILPGTSH